MKWLTGLLLWVLHSAAVQAQEQRSFDYYILSLSWSPEYCSIRPEDRQCGRGYGLVLHGLWPQYQKGYPQSCSQERLPNALARQYDNLYPNLKLAFHEWSKHGTCSGLTPEQYLVRSQALKQAFVIPKALQHLNQPWRVNANELTQVIMTANPNLNAEALAFSCTGGGRFLQEIYVCFEKDASAATACGADVQRRSRKSCGQKDFLIRNIR